MPGEIEGKTERERLSECVVARWYTKPRKRQNASVCVRENVCVRECVVARWCPAPRKRERM